jgi:hypothetical protein
MGKTSNVLNHMLHITSVTIIGRAMGFVKAPWLWVMAV